MTEFLRSADDLFGACFGFAVASSWLLCGMLAVFAVGRLAGLKRRAN